MSSSLPTADKPADEPEVTKDVTVEGYHDGDADNWRDFMGEVLPETDWWKTTTKEHETKYLVLGSENRVELGRSEAEDIEEALASDPDSVRGVRVEKETTTDTNKKHKRYNAGWKVRDAVMEALPDEIAGLEKSGSQFVRETGECVCSVSASISSSKVLEHREARDSEDPYEGDEEVQTVTLNFSLGEAPKSEVDEWSDAIIGPASTALGRMSGIGKVRVATCTEERRGDCFV